MARGSTTDEIIWVYRWLTKRKKYSSTKAIATMEKFAILPPERPYIPDIRFDLSNMSDVDCKGKHRFDKAGVLKLVLLLKIPSVVVTSSGDRVGDVESLCILLRRLRYPCVYYDMIPIFGRSEAQICRVVNEMITLILSKWKDTIYCNIELVRKRLSLYAQAIVQKGSPLGKVWSFADGTKITTCRISATSTLEFEDGTGMNLQKTIYSGHKRQHCLNFQGLTTPDGLCIHFFGPIEGSRHDMTLLRESNLLQFSDARENIFNDYLIYGDPTYASSRWIVSGFKGNDFDESKKHFNKAMSSVRQGVELNFGRIKTLWAFVTFGRQKKIMLSNVGGAVVVAVLLTNCHCCYYNGNQISSYFNLQPPSLEEYLTQ